MTKKTEAELIAEEEEEIKEIARERHKNVELKSSELILLIFVWFILIIILILFGINIVLAFFISTICFVIGIVLRKTGCVDQL